MEQFLTRTVWWAIPTIWLPVVCYSIFTSIRMGHTVPEVALMVAFGIFIWTLMEYTLHRFLFHINTTSYWSVLSLFFLGNLKWECIISALLPDVSRCFWFFIPMFLNLCVVTGETQLIIFFMAVIISIPWMVYGLFFHLLQRLFFAYLYGGFHIIASFYFSCEPCFFP